MVLPDFVADDQHELVRNPVGSLDMLQIDIRSVDTTLQGYRLMDSQLVEWLPSGDNQQDQQVEGPSEDNHQDGTQQMEKQMGDN